MNVTELHMREATPERRRGSRAWLWMLPGNIALLALLALHFMGVI